MISLPQRTRFACLRRPATAGERSTRAGNLLGRPPRGRLPGACLAAGRARIARRLQWRVAAAGQPGPGPGADPPAHQAAVAPPFRHGGGVADGGQPRRPGWLAGARSHATAHAAHGRCHAGLPPVCPGRCAARRLSRPGQRHDANLARPLFQPGPASTRLEPGGFTAVSGLLSTEQGAAAMVLYEDRQGRHISFYIRPPGPESGYRPAAAAAPIVCSPSTGPAAGTTSQWSARRGCRPRRCCSSEAHAS